MKIVLITLGVMVGLVLVHLLIVGLAPWISAPKQSLKRPANLQAKPNRDPAFKGREVTFEANGVTLAAWLFLPDDQSGPAPCVVMGHGLGGTRDCGLDRYAARFSEAGFAVLAFDYRCLGASGGEPRQLIRIPDQLEDWSAAIAYARSLDRVDPSKVALWGSSLGGGYAITAAALDRKAA